ncbi:MAG: toll/interleukin-1 receptor domain-containing protein [Bacteroidales bacterium]|nr:toll/interleukin-1 receptor domain-containing protein [Bacteroidales bacterium]
MENNKQFKYFAFISYNSKDLAWGKRLQKVLENYSMPATLCSEHGWERKPMQPIFFAPTDIQPGGLSDELQERLRASQNLIVICSPNSAGSQWVGREIKFFHELGRTANIHFFIIDGVPHSGNPETECFNPVVKELGMPEILAANIHEKIYSWAWLNRERAYVQLISKLLNVEFDSIWQRHRRQKRRNAVLWLLGMLAVLVALIGVWKANRPVDVELALNESTTHNINLPPMKNAVVTVQVENEIKVDTLASIEATALFANIPARFVGKEARVCFSARNFLPVDTVVELKERVLLDVRRAPAAYGNVRFKLYDELNGIFCANTAVEVKPLNNHNGRWLKTISDENGVVELSFPIEEQDSMYAVKTSLSSNTYTLAMPCGSSTVILVE